MTKEDKMEALREAVQQYGGIIHGDWRDDHGTAWLDVEFPNTTAAVLCLSNYSDLTDGTQPRDPIHRFTTALVVQIPLENE